MLRRHFLQVLAALLPAGFLVRKSEAAPAIVDDSLPVPQPARLFPDKFVLPKFSPECLERRRAYPDIREIFAADASKEPNPNVLPAGCTYEPKSVGDNQWHCYVRNTAKMKELLAQPEQLIAQTVVVYAPEPWTRLVVLPPEPGQIFGTQRERLEAHCPFVVVQLLAGSVNEWPGPSLPMFIGQVIGEDRQLVIRGEDILDVCEPVHGIDGDSYIPQGLLMRQLGVGAPDGTRAGYRIANVGVLWSWAPPAARPFLYTRTDAIAKAVAEHARYDAWKRDVALGLTPPHPHEYGC